MAAMEGGLAGLAVSSGMAAINYAILTIAKAGDNIISTPQLYGGTYTLFAHMFPSQGIEVRFAEDDSAEAIEKLIDNKTKAVLRNHRQSSGEYHRSGACLCGGASSWCGGDCGQHRSHADALQPD